MANESVSQVHSMEAVIWRHIFRADSSGLIRKFAISHEAFANVEPMVNEPQSLLLQYWKGISDNMQLIVASGHVDTAALY